MKSFIWSTAFYGAEIWALRKVGQKYQDSFEMCWRLVLPIVWKIMKYYIRVEGEQNILHTVKTNKNNWFVHILRRNCPLKHIIEGKIEVVGSRGGRRKQLLDGS
jgi:hypothetical protein